MIIEYLLLVALFTAILFGLYSLALCWLRPQERAGGKCGKLNNGCWHPRTSCVMSTMKSQQRPRGVPLFRNEVIDSGPNQLRVEYGSEPGRRSRARITRAAHLKSFTAS